MSTQRKTPRESLSHQGSPRGSLWHRWDPHIHAPGTIHEDQYKGNDPWEEFLTRIEDSDPPIRALGVTDYLSLDLYEEVVAHKKKGRLPKVGLIFPNIEMRFAISHGGSPINFHLLISPEDDDHVDRAKKALAEFIFVGKEQYRCTPGDLIRLGREYSDEQIEDDVALKKGAGQFVVESSQLRDVIHKNDWTRHNILTAIAASSKDGTAQLQEGRLQTLRRRLEREAHIIFSSRPKDREFWLGKGEMSPANIRQEFGRLKPCLHGSDAHSHEMIDNLNKNRYCWIKGDLTFETLRQACLEPEARTYIGATTPAPPSSSRTISNISITGASWLTTPNLPLNSGLVAIIGVRGSGKTALVEMIAAGTSSLPNNLSEQSFVQRAKQHLPTSVSITWADGEESASQLRLRDAEDGYDLPNIQYLSQQFVEHLCSSDGLAGDLIQELERVVFQAHSLEERLGATNFREMLDVKISYARSARDQAEEALGEVSTRFAGEWTRRATLPVLKKTRESKARAIERDKRDRAKLMARKAHGDTNRFRELTEALEKVQSAIDRTSRKEQLLLKLKNEVSILRDNKITHWLDRKIEEYKDIGFDPDRWENFRLEFKGDVDAIIDEAIAELKRVLLALTGPLKDELELGPKPESSPQLISQNANLSKQPLSLLNKELERVRARIGIDRANAQHLEKISLRIKQGEAEIEKIDKDIILAQQADEKISEIRKERASLYREIFDAITQEQKALEKLYYPLKENLRLKSGILNKFSISTHRKVATKQWAEAGEELLDLRMSGPFRGTGALYEAASNILHPAWKTGTTDEVSSAMKGFLKKYGEEIYKHCPEQPENQREFSDWEGKICAWLYDTNHITVTYRIHYDGIEIGQLSPGIRGIVLLLLYLAVDQDDGCPLVIDQPEENLDPKSIYEELVPLFREAKTHRQIVIVTHNANLVVNTDADQVIVASSGRRSIGKLPEISYTSGSLENPEIRNRVCEILEGGEDAFQERARRLRLKFSPT